MGHFKAKNSVDFGTFMRLCNHSFCVTPKPFHHPKIKLGTHRQPLPFLACPQLLPAFSPLLSLWFPYPGHHESMESAPQASKGRVGLSVPTVG